MQYHFTPDRMAILKKTKEWSISDNMQRMESLTIVGKDVNEYYHYRKWYEGSSKIVFTYSHGL